MPRSRHCLDDTTDDKFTTFSAAGCEQYLKVMFAVFATFKLVEQTIRERTEALRTSVKRKPNVITIHRPTIIDPENIMNPESLLTQNIADATTRPAS